MNVVVIGSGYVGLVTGCCLAEVGNQVVCVDHDARKVAALNDGRLPFHEPELDDVLTAQVHAGRLSFETRIGRAMANADVVFLAVGTPPLADGGANLDNLLSCARELADTAFRQCLVVVKSTVPVGTSDLIEQLLNHELSRARGQPLIPVASNPEFLSEGRAVQDFRHPERIVIGANDAQSASVLTQLYAPFERSNHRLLIMDRRSAEFAKYACNAMLAARISMVNELAGIGGNLGADMAAVCRVMKSDPRIGPHYLQPGVGYGGSCLPKDLHALIHAARSAKADAHMLESIQTVNEGQRKRLLAALLRHFDGRLKDRRLAIWGLSFKPGTDDVRAAPSLALIRSLLLEGARISVYDPVAGPSTRTALGEAASLIYFADSAIQACDDADALLLMTEWEEFREPDFNAVAARMRGSMLFDARGLYATEHLQQHGLGHYHLASEDTPAVNREQPANAVRDRDWLLPRTRLN